MSTTGLDTFDKTLQETNLWLKSVMRGLDTSDRHLALSALRATLHALRDRVGPQNAVHLGAQLPMLLRGLYYEGWRMAGTPTKARHKEAFLAPIGRALPRGMEIDAERAARAVFDTMWERVSPDEVAKIVRLLPEEVRDLFPRVAEEA
jgi:uncharacterized protein (DUF2267 family)